MKHIQYNTQGTCSILIDVTADDDNVIQNVAFLGGCNGNLQGICRLVKGQKIDDVIAKLDGIRCGKNSLQRYWPWPYSRTLVAHQPQCQ